DARALPAFTESVQHRRGIELSVQRREKAAERRLQRVEAAGEATLGERAGNDAALRRATGMEALGHGAEPRGIEPRCLRRADAERMRAPARVEPQDRGSGRRSADRASSARDVIAAGRMAHAGADADAQPDLVTGR